MVDPDARYLYYVLEKGKAIRYGVTVGEEALVFSGVAKVGRKRRVAVLDADRRHQEAARQHSGFRRPWPAQSAGRARPLPVHRQPDTLYRIHGTNQPEYIGSAISSGCIRMTNEDVIDLYSRVKLGTPVVVLAPSQGDSPFNPRMALGGGLVAN